MRKTSIGAAISLVASLALASSVLAAGPFNNGGFETASSGASLPGAASYETLSTTTNTTAMDGWTVTAGSVDWVSNGFLGWQSQEGTYSVDMNGSPGPDGTVGTISQTFDTTMNVTYVVQFWVSNNTTCDHASTYSMTASAGGSSETVDVASTYDVLQGEWLAADPLLFAAKSDTATITFAADSSNTSNCGVVVDNVTVTQATGAWCKHGGWHAMVETADGLYSPFTNQGACVSSYAKAGMVPIGNTTSSQPGDTGATSDPGAQCKKGGWQGLTDGNGNQFKNQGACVSYYARGGK